MCGLIVVSVYGGCKSDQIDPLFNGGDYEFTSSRDVAANDGLKTVALGDLDANGTTDLVTIDAGGFTVYLRDESGSFYPGVTTALGVGPSDLVLADMNGDDILDVVASNGTSATAMVLNGVGDGTFEANEDALETDENPVRIYAKDVDGDGILDIITVNHAGDSVTAILSGGAPEPTPPPPGMLPPPPVLMGTPSEFGVGEGPTCIAFADLNSDAYLDMAVTNEDSDTITLLFNRGDGTFAEDGEIFVGDGPSAVAFADVNDDDIDDIIVTHRFDNTIWVILGTVVPAVLPDDYVLAEGETLFEGNFAAYTPILYNTGSAPNDVAVFDLDRDGDLDILAVNTISNDLTMLLGGNTGEFSNPGAIALGVDPLRLAWGFIDNNTTPDVAVSISDTPTATSPVVTLLFGAGATDPGPLPTPVFSISTTTLPDGVLSEAYATTITTLNGATPMTASLVSGTLPIGISMSVSDTSVVLSGVPIESGIFPITLRAVSSTAEFDAISYDLIINQTPPGPYANFTASPPMTVGAEPLDLIAVDVNADGILDLISADASANMVSVALGNGAMGIGDGTFAPPASFTAGARPISVDAGDVDGDGNVDLVTANANGNSVSIMLGDGMGMFASAVSFSSGGILPRAIALGDFDGDMLPDIAVANFTSHNFALLINTTAAPGVPAFAAAVTRQDGATTMLKPIDLIAVDLDNDGNLDVVTANSGSDDLTTFMGDGTGNFSVGMNFVVGTLPKAVATGDMNEDGNLDLIAINETSFDGSVLLGNGVGGFAATVDTAISGFAIDMAIADFDGDSHLDIASANFTGDTVLIVRGTGGAGLDVATGTTVGNEPAAVVTGDFNGDGLPDLAIANSADGTLVVLING